MPGVLGWLQVALGVALVVAGLVMLGRARAVVRGRTATGGDSDRAGARPARRLSVPTHLVIALVLMIAGFHAGVWAFPADKMPLQLPRQWWWAWVLVGIAMIPASLALDRLERKRLGGG